MTPYGGSRRCSLHMADLKRVAMKAVEALTAFNGTKYKVGPICKILECVAGNSVDWAHDKVTKFFDS